jgi:hypothetical protein
LRRDRRRSSTGVHSSGRPAAPRLLVCEELDLWLHHPQGRPASGGFRRPQAPAQASAPSSAEVAALKSSCEAVSRRSHGVGVPALPNGRRLSRRGAVALSRAGSAPPHGTRRFRVG